MLVSGLKVVMLAPIKRWGVFQGIEFMSAFRPALTWQILEHFILLSLHGYSRRERAPFLGIAHC